MALPFSSRRDKEDQIQVHIHNHYETSILEPKIDKILRNLEALMATVAELNSELVQINATTDELAADVADLLTKVGDPAALDEVRAGLVSVKERLQGVASQHAPTPGEVPVDPAQRRR